MSLFDIFRKKEKPSLDAINNRTCPKCGNSINDEARYCFKCGYSFEEEHIKCSKCNNDILKNTNYCPYCGNNINTTESINYEIQKQVENEPHINEPIIVEEAVVEINNDTPELDEELNINNDVNDKNEELIEAAEEQETINPIEEINNSDSEQELILDNHPDDSESIDLEDAMKQMLFSEEDDFTKSVKKFVDDYADPGVYYSVLYGKYKNEFNSLGITSFDAVKREVDKYISFKYIKTSKYISIYENESDIEDAILNYIKESNAKFRIFELSKQFPGIQWPVLERIINDSFEVGMIKKLNNEQFPTYQYDINYNEQKYLEEMIDRQFNNNLKYDVQNLLNDEKETIRSNKLSEKEKKELYDFVIELLRENNCEMISLNIVLSELSLFKKQLYDDLHLDKDINILADMIRENYSNQLYVNKPFVSDRPVRNTTDATCDFLRTLNEFDKREMDDYQSKIGLISHKSYELFIENLYDDFIRVDITRMVKKSSFIVDEITLKKLKKNLDFYFDNNDILDTKNFRGYPMFPTINDYKWNKYLLIGIIKGFYDNDFSIEKYGKTINDMNYRIRRNSL